jgi:hypothetical protein
MIRRKRYVLTLPFLFLAVHLIIIPVLLQPWPDGQIVHRNLILSLATEGQNSSRGSQPPQQLGLVQSFNDMRVSPSASGTSNPLPSRSCSSQLPTTPYSCNGSLTPTTPHTIYHHLIPFLPCPLAISKPPPSSAAHIHSNSSLLHITQSPLPLVLPRQLHSLRRSKRDSPGWEPRYDPRGRAYRHAAPPGHAHPSICRRQSPPLLLRPRCQDDLVSEHNQRRQHLRRRALAPRMGGAPHARRLSVFR